MKHSASSPIQCSRHPVAWLGCGLKPLAAIAFSVMAVLGGVSVGERECIGNTARWRRQRSVRQDVSAQRREQPWTSRAFRARQRGDAGHVFGRHLGERIRLAREDIRFVATDGRLSARPCFSRQTLERLESISPRSAGYGREGAHAIASGTSDPARLHSDELASATPTSA